MIGFWYKKKSASDAGKKAFIVNRIGDFGFILGTLMVFVMFGSLDFQQVAAAVSSRPVEHGIAADQVHACRHHRRGMDEGGHGRGAFHRVRQPRVERELRAFADRAAEYEEHGRS